MSGPLASTRPAVHHQDVIGQPRDLVRRVADIEHRNLKLIVQALQVRQDLLLALQIQRRQRLVHQQHARVDGQRPRDADTLALAAGERCRLAIQQMRNAKQLDRVLKAEMA